MIILGFDPGTAIVGWGIIDTGKEQRTEQAVCLDYGCILTPKNESNSARLLSVYTGARELLEKYRPELVSVEKLFYTRNQTTVMTVSQARGVLLLAIEQAGNRLVEFTPLQVKQALTGYGRAEKKDIQQMVKTLLHLGEIPKPDDAADALAIALSAAQAENYEQILNMAG